MRIWPRIATPYSHQPVGHPPDGKFKRSVLHPHRAWSIFSDWNSNSSVQVLKKVVAEGAHRVEHPQPIGEIGVVELDGDRVGNSSSGAAHHSGLSPNAGVRSGLV